MMSKQERQEAADEWARDTLTGLFDELADGQAEFETYIHYMFAGFLRFFGPIWGDDPFDFLCRITLVAYALDDGGVAFKFAFIDDLIDEMVESGGPDDGGEAEAVWD